MEEFDFGNILNLKDLLEMLRTGLSELDLLDKARKYIKQSSPRRWLYNYEFSLLSESSWLCVDDFAKIV